MTDEQLAEIEARAEKAFPGPWKHYIDREWHSPDRVIEAANTWVVIRDENCEHNWKLGRNEDNYEFIAHARTDIPMLIAEVRRLRAQYEELRDALCSKAWAPRDNHERVVALAKMMKRRESKIEAARDGGEDLPEAK